MSENRHRVDGVYERVVYPARIHNSSIKISIMYSALNDQLSLSGHGDGCYGQIQDLLINPDIQPLPGYTKEKCRALHIMWERWHLNDMRSGTPNQEKMVRVWKAMGNAYDYDAVCRYLESNDLLVDNGYRYGSAWLHEKVPDDVLMWLFTLPGKGNTYDDIDIEIKVDDFLRVLEEV